MRPEAVLAKSIRIAVAKDGRARVVPNFVGKMVAWNLVQRVRASGDAGELASAWPIECGLGLGSADLVGIVKGSGRVFCLEVKTPGAKKQAHEPDQERWQTAVRRLGGFVAVVRSTDEAIAAVTRALAGAGR